VLKATIDKIVQYCIVLQDFIVFCGSQNKANILGEMVNIPKILIVDDEENIRALVRFNLEKAGYQVTEASNGKNALETISADRPDLIILDLMLPIMDGLDVCRKLKGSSITSAIPIIMLTAKSDEIDRVIGLELGADDYLTKPFGSRELLARIKAVLRRSILPTSIAKEIHFGTLLISLTNYAAYLSGKKLELTLKEFELLCLLVQNPNQAFSREKLLENIWGYEYYGDTRTVDVHIRHLRAKLDVAPEIAEAIETVRGVGYRLHAKT
jgi:two-component system, OmpR family, alkaline phosphatase synthesis response regulator PhoP